MRRKALLAPFVATLAVACTKPVDATPEPVPTSKPKPKTPEPPPKPVGSGPIVFDNVSSCYQMADGEKVYLPRCPESVLPTPHKDHLVYKSDYCRSVPGNAVVQCPPGGATAEMPVPAAISTTDGSTYVDLGSMKCFRGVNVKCPPGLACNPPAPTPIDCPAALLPKLVGGTKPTKTSGGKCWFNTVEVACPK
jgi:hypothetical protein